MSRDTTVTARQPFAGELDVLRMPDDQIKNLIYATHLPAEKDFDAKSLFVVVKSILKPATHVVENVFLGQEDLEILEEEVSRDSFNPTLGIVEQLSLEMAHKALDAETAHRTTMSIFNKLSSYSWQTKAVLALATFALDYEKYMLATAQLDPSTQPIESEEIPKHVLVTVELQKYEKEISEFKKMINEMLTKTECIFELEKQKSSSTNDTEDVSILSSAMDSMPVLVYWIIMNVVACTTLMFCLTSSEDNTRELSLLANRINLELRLQSSEIGLYLYFEGERKAKRRMKEFLQTPDEVTEVLKALIFGKDDVQSLIDSCSDELVSLDVLKNKGVLLFISDLHVSGDDILIMKPIYEEITDYNIVWIPIVVQWTDELRKKFDMLRSRMPWYVLQHFSQLAGSKLIKEEWHFENDPVVVAMDAKGNVEGKNVLPMIREEGTQAFPIGCGRLCAFVMRTRGPHTIEDYTFYCGGKDSRWIEQFSEKVNVVAEDPIIKEALISVEFCRIEKVNKWNPFRRGSETRKKNEEIQKILPSFENEKRWAVLIKWSTRIISLDGPTILKILEMFHKWKQYVSERGFEICFKEYHDKLCLTNPNPSTSQPV